MNEGIPKTEKEREPEKFTFPKRVAFHFFLMKKMLGAETDEELDNEQGIRWTETYAKIISDIVDDKENTEIRNFIAEENYDKASELVNQMLMEKMKKIAA